jgi:hypothetical protein
VHTGQGQAGRVSREQIQKLLKTKIMGEPEKSLYLEGSSGHVNGKPVSMQKAGKTFVRVSSADPRNSRQQHNFFATDVYADLNLWRTPKPTPRNGLMSSSQQRYPATTGGECKLAVHLLSTLKRDLSTIYAALSNRVSVHKVTG